MSTPPENRQKLDPMDAKLRLFPQNSHEIPGFAQKQGFYSDLHRSILKVDRVERGRVICSLTVDSAVAVGTSPSLPFSPLLLLPA